MRMTHAQGRCARIREDVGVGFPKLGDTILGVPQKRIIVYLGGPQILGNCPVPPSGW